MSNGKKRSARNAPRSPARQRRNILIALAVGLFAMLICGSTTLLGGFWFYNSFVRESASDLPEGAPTWAADSPELTVAASPLMAPVLAELAEQFNAQANRTADNQQMVVHIVTYEPENMVDAALQAPPFQALSPDSALWLDRLEQQWSQQLGETEAAGEIPIGQRRTSGTIRYAVSPVVIAAWESVARELGWPERAIGWQDIQQQATRDPNFKWNHPSTNNASGLLATLAEFYAGAGLTRGLTEEAATAPETLAYVQAVEATVRFYGEGEEVIVERLAEEGRNFLDAFVAQERVVIDWNQTQRGERLVAIYPAEGTLWTDHPLALLELGGNGQEQAVTDNQRQTYQAFARYLTDTQAQSHLLAAGYRPADLTIPLDRGDSPFANTDAVDWRQPQTTLQMPSAAVIDVVQNVWYYTKRPTNVYLVVDTSGSMEGDKIELTRAALAAFVQQIQGDRDQLGLVEFGGRIKNFTPLRVMDESARSDILAQIDGMQATGGTALIDAVYDAVVDLQAQNDSEAINAVVVMTDGQENESRYRLADLQDLVRSGSGRPPVIFTIAFGRDADEQLLQEIARIGEGQLRRADETDIEELYRIISTYF